MTSPVVSIVIPTYNESENVPKIIALIETAMAGAAWEIIFVDDDSPDDTASIAKAIGADDPRVRCIRRVNRRGLAGACIEGMLSSSAPYVAVMDADLQHDETILPAMIARLANGDADVVVGTRFADGGKSDAGFSSSRAFASRFATRLADAVIGSHVSDPMSGFFAMKRAVVDDVVPKLTTSGFKILLDILSSSKSPLRIAEVGYQFRSRQDGQSKFDMRAMADFFSLLVHKATGGVIPVRFVLFAGVGAVGVIVHLLVLRLGLGARNIDFETAQIIATFAAMTSNFFINNAITYSDRKLRGLSAGFGLLKFYAICSVGAVANVGIATWLFGFEGVWWLAGLAGIIVGSVFNFATSSLLVWRRSE